MTGQLLFENDKTCEIQKGALVTLGTILSTSLGFLLLYTEIKHSANHYLPGSTASKRGSACRVETCILYIVICYITFVPRRWDL